MDFKDLFSPLSREFCLWFYYLSIIGFVFLVITLISAIVVGITKKKGGEYFMTMLMVALSYFIFYFQNRLLYSMCVM